MNMPILGGLSAASFMRRYWQKEALLARKAEPSFRGLATPQQLFKLACRDDVESRLLVRERGKWALSHGPFRASDFRTLPERDWTLLVQGLNLHLPEGDALVRRFSFIPYARLDDLMVSYAVPGGGVGPHFDSYDVFLLQGSGRRRWRIGRQKDETLLPGLPLRILKHFTPTYDFVVEPGDLLYLPPEYAHDGIAVDTCTTYSIGMRASPAEEVATAFLDWLRDSLPLRGRYTDPDQKPTREPARIDAAMHRRFDRVLQQVQWNDAAVARFLGAYLTEPKPTTFFDHPAKPLPIRAFARAAMRRGVVLDRRTQMLYDRRNVYINGGDAPCRRGERSALEKLANARALSGSALHGETLIVLLHGWYRDGFVHLG